MRALTAQDKTFFDPETQGHDSDYAREFELKQFEEKKNRRPPTLTDWLVKRSTKRVHLIGGRIGTIKVVTRMRGEAVFVYDPDHIMDARWSYPQLQVQEIYPKGWAREHSMIKWRQDRAKLTSA